MKHPDPRDIPTLDDLVFPGESHVDETIENRPPAVENAADSGESAASLPAASLRQEPFISINPHLSPASREHAFPAAPYLQTTPESEAPSHAHRTLEDPIFDTDAEVADSTSDSLDLDDWPDPTFLSTTQFDPNREGPDLDNEPRFAPLDEPYNRFEPEPDEPLLGRIVRLDPADERATHEPRIGFDGRPPFSGEMALQSDTETRENEPVPDPAMREGDWMLFDRLSPSMIEPAVSDEPILTHPAAREDVEPDQASSPAEIANDTPPTLIQDAAPNAPDAPQDQQTHIEQIVTRALEAEWPEFQRRVITAVMRELNSDLN